MASSKYKRDKRGYYNTRVWDGTYVDGKKRYVYIRSSKSSKDLEKKVAELNANIANRNVTRSSNISLHEYATGWLSVYKAGSSDNTKAMYQNCIDKHIAKIKVPLHLLSRAQYITLLNTTEGSRTKQIIQMTMRQILKSAVKDKLITPAVMEEILNDVPKVKYKSAEKRALYEYEKNAIKNVILPPKEQAFLFLLYGCGLRRGEALALTRFDVNLNRREISVNKAVAFPKNDPILKETKNGVNRVVPIPDSIFPTVQSYIKSLRGSNLFPMGSDNYMSKSSYVKMWSRITKALGEVSDQPINGLTAHIFRHNYCSSLCYKIPEISINKIAELLGDDPRMVVDVYNHEILGKEKPTETISNALAL